MSSVSERVVRGRGQHELIGWAWTEEALADPGCRLGAHEHRRFSDRAWEIAIVWPDFDGDVAGARARMDDLHPEVRPGLAPEGWWWACDKPERAFEPALTLSAPRCRPCAVALGAAAFNRPELFVPAPRSRRMVPIGDWYDALRILHDDLPPLPKLRVG